MRLVCHFEKESDASRLSNFLNKEGVTNSFQAIEGGRRYSIWVHQEEQVDCARKWHAAYTENPNHQRFSFSTDPTPTAKTYRIKDNHIQELRAKAAALGLTESDEPIIRRSPNMQYKPLTSILIGLTLLFFLLGSIASGSWKGGLPGDAAGQREARINEFYSPVSRFLAYDNPPALSSLEKLEKEYPGAMTGELSTLQPGALALIQDLRNNPMWAGYYWEFIAWARGESPSGTQPELFGSIKAGQWWRTFTPAFLHGSLMHLVFNLVWMLVLGNKIEQRIGFGRFAILVLSAALLSNLGQYLVSGPHFGGLSAIVNAFFGFMLMRQLIAPEEGYEIPINALQWIIALQALPMLLSLWTTYTRISGGTGMEVGIANTAHVVGLLVGLIIGRMTVLARAR